MTNDFPWLRDSNNIEKRKTNQTKTKPDTGSDNADLRMTRVALYVPK